MNNNIVNIKVEQIYQHPENPRKDVGDVSELADFIQKNGIMQNLTVIPLSALDEEPDKQPDADNISLSSDFIVLIGHRRLAAAKQAGLTEVPCRIISKISKKEQISTMLEENMQREDLTVYEQAQGFQLMLDLGETEETIAEKTGFSKTTVKHRVNIAKLDQKVLKQKESSKAFQLSITDLYALEKIKSIKKRNEVLKNATSSRDLAWRANRAAEEELQDENEKKLVAMLEKEGFKKAPKGAENQLWGNAWDIVESFILTDKLPEKINTKKLKGCFYVRSSYSIKMIRKPVSKKQEPTKEELEKKQREANSKRIKDIAKEMAKQREAFVRSIISGTVKPLKDHTNVMDNLWKAMVSGYACLNKNSMLVFFRPDVKYYYDLTCEEREQALQMLESESMLHQMMIAALNAAEAKDFTDYKGKYDEQKGATVIALTEALAEYGFSYANEEQYEVLNGTHECYVKEEA